MTVYQGDCVERMREMQSESIQLVVTSPPYDKLRQYGGHSWDFKSAARELTRLLVDGGVICWNVGDSVVDGSETLTSAKQKIFFREECGLRVHDTMIWHKANFSAPSSNRYHQVFEYIFVLSKGAPRCFNPIKDKPNIWAGTGTFGKNTIRIGDDRLAERKRNIITDNGMRGNVWYGNTAGQENVCEPTDHPAKMARWLAEDLIRSWSNPGDTVLDPFGGSGTTGQAALEHGRKAILIELNPAYCALIEKRCEVTIGLPLEAA